MKVLNRILEILLGVVVAVMVAGCFWQVFTRFVLNSPSKYTEELLRYLLIWMTMLGVPYAYGKDSHLSINLITRSFSEKGMLMTKIGIEILILFLSIFVMIVGGWIVTMNSSGQISPALHMPMELYYLCVPVGGVMMVVYCLNRLGGFVKQWKTGDYGIAQGVSENQEKWRISRGKFWDFTGKKGLQGGENCGMICMKSISYKTGKIRASRVWEKYQEDEMGRKIIFLEKHGSEGSNSELLRWRRQIEHSLNIRPMAE